MPFRFTPRIKLGSVTFGKRGASIRTGIPGLTFTTKYSSGESSAAGFVEEPVNQPTTATYSMSEGVGSLFLFGGLFAGLLYVFGSLGNRMWYFIMPFFFVYNPLTMLFRQHIYGKKKEYITKSDGRYRGGYKVTGSRIVDDTDRRIPYEADSVARRRLIGGVKLAMVLAALLVGYPARAAEPLYFPPKLFVHLRLPGGQAVVVRFHQAVW